MKNIINLQEKLDKHSTLAVNLAEAMHQHGINEAELARRTHIPQPTLHKILAGRTEDPRFSTLQQLASFFKVTVDELVTGQSLKQVSENSVYAIPVLSWRDCLKGQEYISGLTTKVWKQWLSVENAPHGAFGIGTTACSEPRFPRGTVLVIDPTIIPKDGDLVIAQYPDAEEATLRELSIDGPNKFLFSINPQITKDTFDKSMKILGVVIESRFSFS